MHRLQKRIIFRNAIARLVILEPDYEQWSNRCIARSLPAPLEVSEHEMRFVPLFRWPGTLKRVLSREGSEEIAHKLGEAQPPDSFQRQRISSILLF
jgi:hypothetical protein